MGGQRVRLKPDSVPTKFIFTVEKPKRKKPADRASLNTKKTTTEKSQPYSVSEPVNTENSVEHTDLKSGSGGIETKQLESEDLVQTEEENWEHQLKLKDDEMSCLLEKWQTKKRELNKKNTSAGKSTGRRKEYQEGAGIINREESLQHRNCKG